MLVLIVEDDQGIAFLVGEAIEEMGREIAIVNTGADAIEFILRRMPDLIILDYSLPDMNAKELMALLTEKNIQIPQFIVSTGRGDEIIAVEMMKMGAYDYLIKDNSLMQRIPGVVVRATESIAQQRKLNEALEQRQISDVKLAEERKRLANIIKATNVGTWEWIVNNDHLVVNERWSDILGYPYADISPVKTEMLKKYTHPDDMHSARKTLDDHLGGVVDYFEVEVRLKHVRDHWVWVLVRGCATEYSPAGNPVVMAGTILDITDKKRKEELQKEVEVANKTLEFKQNFLASMSHEMRTPLTGILGISEMLSKTDLDDSQIDLVNTLRNASENLNYIIDQVLDYSKIEAGKMRIALRPFYTEKLIARATKTFHSMCRKPISFVTNVDKEIPEILLADQKRIFQIVNNLINNAVKYSDKGQISLSLKKESDVDKENIMLRIEVSDTGIGIRPEKHQLIFSPFSHVHMIDTSYYEGTGLNLAICKELVELHGGSIGIESEPGVGTTFWFTIKAGLYYPENNEKKLIEPLTKSTGINLRILLVEDKVITQKVVGLQLNEMGHKVDVASNGREALEKYSKDKYDLILMDIQMPVMDGITATKELKKIRPAPPPVVGLSANAFDGDRMKYMSLGFDEYLTKPMQRDQFLGIVNKLFE